MADTRAQLRKDLVRGAVMTDASDTIHLFLAYRLRENSQDHATAERMREFLRNPAVLDGIPLPDMIDLDLKCRSEIFPCTVSEQTQTLHRVVGRPVEDWDLVKFRSHAGYLTRMARWVLGQPIGLVSHKLFSICLFCE